MKISSAPGRGPLNSQIAWGCLTTNIAVPGLGSWLGGRRFSAGPQLALTVAGVFLTLIFGVRFFVWFLRHYAEIRDPDADPWESLKAVWLAVRWALLGFALFGFSWLWALITSWSLVRQARRSSTDPAAALHNPGPS